MSSQKVSSLPVGVPKVRFSFKNHLLPPVLGVAVSLLMYGMLNFPYYSAQLQYYANKQLSHSKNSGIVTTPSKDTSDIIIPSIDVKAPVIYESSTNNATIAYDLRSGVVHYGNTAVPGQNGNVVIFGHSSGVAWTPGNFKFVFTLLDKMQVGQQISIDYQGVRYVYVVTDAQIVAPTDMSVLKSNGKAELSLITCTPVGTSKNRLVLHAKQVHPDVRSNTDFKQNPAIVSELPGN